MKIWLDTIPQSSNSLDQVSDDCKDCPSPEMIFADPYIHFPQHVDPIQDKLWREYLYTRTLCSIQPLYIQALTNECSLACCPTGSGRIVLLDNEALALLHCFQYPTTFNKVIQCLDYLSIAQVETATSYLYQYGLLRDIHASTDIYISKESDVLRVWLHVTNACNLRCDYCYVAKSTEHMQEDTAREAVEAVFRSAVRHHYKHVHLRYAGGEASLQANNIIQVHDYAQSLAQQHGIKLTAHMLSNGVYISSQVILQLRERRIGVMISLDGVGEYHDRQRPLINGRGSFTRVDKTILRLLEHDLKPSIAVTVSSRNLDGIPMLMGYIIERNLSFSLNYYRENNLSVHLTDLQLDEERMIAVMREAFAVIAEHLPKHSLLNSLIDKANLQSPHQYACGVGRNYMVINQHGEVAKCQVEMKHTVATVSVDDPLQYVRDDRDGVQGFSVDEKEGCRDCTWRYWCTGGCPALTYRMTGRYDIQSPNCHIYQELFPDVLRLEALRLLKYSAPIIF